MWCSTPFDTCSYCQTACGAHRLTRLKHIKARIFRERASGGEKTRPKKVVCVCFWRGQSGALRISVGAVCRIAEVERKWGGGGVAH